MLYVPSFYRLFPLFLLSFYCLFTPFLLSFYPLFTLFLLSFYPLFAPTSNEAEFGHGFTIAGCLLLHLLGQRSSFEVLDFSSHVLQLNAHEVCHSALIF
jgi:hypothetical protein